MKTTENEKKNTISKYSIEYTENQSNALLIGLGEAIAIDFVYYLRIFILMFKKFLAYNIFNLKATFEGSF